MVDVNCKYCDKKFQARPADIKRGWGKFCSKSCKAKEQEKRTGQYKKLTEEMAAMKRDSNRDHLISLIDRKLRTIDIADDIDVFDTWSMGHEHNPHIVSEEIEE